MAKFSMAQYLTAVTLFIFNLKVFSAEPSYCVFHNKTNEVPRCRSEFSVYGVAMAINGRSSVQLINSNRSNAKLIVYRKPIKVVDGNPPIFPSFPTILSFSLSNQSGDGLVFLMVPKGYRFTNVGKRSFGRSKMGLLTSKFRVVVVEFDTSFDPQYVNLTEIMLALTLKVYYLLNSAIFHLRIFSLIVVIGLNTLSSGTNRMGISDSVPLLDSSSGRSKYNAKVVQSKSKHCTNYNVDYSNVHTVEDDAISYGTHCRVSSVPSYEQETNRHAITASSEPCCRQSDPSPARS
ncbi:hypothetical protein LWI28_027659 [Acer negundo]|uniref:Legume lectin domain-containing protein n=1 Tax=Acer negundo TaxID=4023 RepID=A0AAD5IAW7_ACENE|nr:hypothetical protein LWI28_027659 [Acer negundo]